MTSGLAVHPGEFIKEELEARGWLQRDLAFVLGCPEQAVNMITSGKRGISPDMAKALGNAFDVSAELFLNLQRSYELSLARDPDPSISRKARLQEHYPIREMIKRGWLEDTDINLLEEQMVRFFQINNISEIPYLAHAAKKTNYEEREIHPLQLVWLFRAKQIAASMSVPRFSKKKLNEAINELRDLLIEPEESRKVGRILAECGVRFLIIEPFPGGKIDGVCFWLDKESPVIAISTRFDRIDNFWFVLRHEIEHVLRGDGMKQEIIDADMEKRSGKNDNLPEEEIIADKAALEFCVPKEKLNSFITRKKPYFYEKDVVAFARMNGIHPGLVIGQMQHYLDNYGWLRKPQYFPKIRHFVTQGAIFDGWGQVAPVDV